MQLFFCGLLLCWSQRCILIQPERSPRPINHLVSLLSPFPLGFNWHQIDSLCRIKGLLRMQVRWVWNSSPTSSLSFSFFSYYSGPSINPSYELATTSSTKQEQHKYTSKPATTCTTTFSLISFRLTISTISSSLSYEIVDDFDPYPGYFYVSLFSDLENTEIPSSVKLTSEKQIVRVGTSSSQL